MKKTQSEQILEYLQQNGSITPIDALMKFHCMRLGARIHDLKAEGHRIRTEMESHKTEDGRTSHYARYVLVR
jgi:hypothetical protein